jgi:D-arabinose 1-dehydrogenase-like Zn-dependent alcohol dehydrogenase
MTEEFAIEDINAAFAHLEAGKARYRVVLKI